MSKNTLYFANVSIITEWKKKFTEKYYETIGNFGFAQTGNISP